MCWESAELEEFCMAGQEAVVIGRRGGEKGTGSISGTALYIAPGKGCTGWECFIRTARKQAPMHCGD